MSFPEYTPERAEVLYIIEFPESGAPDGIRLLWIDTLSDDIMSRINCDIHAHSFFEIHFILSGSASYDICGESVMLQGGNALFLPPMTSHRFISCDGDFIRSTVLFAVTAQQNDSFYKKGVKIFDIPEAVIENFAFILKKCESPDVFTPSVIAGRTTEIIHSVLKSLGITPAPLLSEGKDPRILTAIRFIENNRHRAIGCDDVARECCLSPKQLGRIFKHTMGVSLYEYITETRLQYAKHLLCTSGLSVKETAFMMGFESESCFAAFFKRRAGISPGSYRQKGRMQ